MDQAGCLLMMPATRRKGSFGAGARYPQVDAIGVTITTADFVEAPPRNPSFT